MTNRMRWMAAVLMLVGLAGRGEAQVSARVSSYLSYTDNLYLTYNRRSEWMTLTYFDFDYAPGKPVNLYYSGSASLFAGQTELFSHRHGLGLSYARSDSGRRVLYAGVELSTRLDRPVYNVYDYFQGQGYVNAKVYLPKGVLGRAGYRIRYREYVHAREYSHLEQTGFVQISRSWQTGTTVLLAEEVGVKGYLREGSADPFDLRTRADGDRLQAQFLGRVRVAQALARRTGLQAEYLHRVNAGGANRYAELESYGEELFDDRYGYAGREARLVLKQLAPGGVRLEATGQYEWRNYEGRPALDLEGYLIDPVAAREDRRRSMLVELEKVFALKDGAVRSVGIHLEWLYQKVDSNDPYYRTSMKMGSVGMEVGF